MTKELTELGQLPDYNEPKEKLGTKSTDTIHWSKSLSSYKTIDHDRDWVYMYAKTNLPESFLRKRSVDTRTNSDLSTMTDGSSVSTDSKEKDPIIDIAVVIYDRYPKAKYHLLVLPLLVGADNPAEFRKTHLPMLKGVHNLAKMIAKNLEEKYGAGPFCIGYHAKPSMSDLHIHIVSQDFDSEFIKHKQHYNSFVNPDFFLTTDRVEEDLKKHGYVNINSNPKTVLEKEMRCHICREPIWSTGPKAIKELQDHLKTHIKTTD